MSAEQKVAARLRQATPDDLSFLGDMCMLAAFPTTEPEEIPPKDEALQEPWLKPYVDELMARKGDYVLVAEDSKGNPIGAAWYRDYGRTAADVVVPAHELTIGVRPEMQGRKVGEQLLGGLLSHAADEGIETLGLQVANDNTRARHLYEKLDFQPTGENGDFVVMSKLPTSL